MSALKIYWGSGSGPAWRVLVGLEEKGLEYESKLIEFSKGEHKGPEIMQYNPRGQVPTLVDGDAVVCESLAALLYLEDTYPEPALLPTDKIARAKVLQRFQETSNYVEKASAPVYMVMRKQLNTEEDMKVFDEKVEALKKELAYWDGYVKEGYVAGSEFTLADVALAPFLMTTMRFGATFDDFPNLKAYTEKMKSRPSIEKTSPPHWKTSDGIPAFAGKV